MGHDITSLNLPKEYQAAAVAGPSAQHLGDIVQELAPLNSTPAYVSLHPAEASSGVKSSGLKGRRRGRRHVRDKQGRRGGDSPESNVDEKEIQTEPAICDGSGMRGMGHTIPGFPTSHATSTVGPNTARMKNVRSPLSLPEW